MIAFTPCSELKSATVEYDPGWQLRNELAWTPLRASEARLSAAYYPLCARRSAGRWHLGAIVEDDLQHAPLTAPDGRWLGAYVPISLRTYPVRLADARTGTLEKDVEIAVGAPTGRPRQVLRIRGDDGSPAAELKRTYEGLLAARAEQERLGAMLDLLAVAGLLVPLAGNETCMTVDAAAFAARSALALSAMARHSLEPIELAVAIVYSQRNLRQGVRPAEPKSEADSARASASTRELAMFEAMNYRLDDSDLYSADWLEGLTG
jgi:hypothetical protein